MGHNYRASSQSTFPYLPFKLFLGREIQNTIDPEISRYTTQWKGDWKQTGNKLKGI